MNDFVVLVKEKRGFLIAGAVFSALASILLIVPFILIFEIIKLSLLSSSIESSKITELFGFALVALLLRYVFAFLGSFCCHKTAFGLTYSIRMRLTEHIGKLPMGFWSDKGTSQVLKVVQDDVETIEEYIGHQVPDGVSAFVLPFATIIYLFTVDWRVAIFTSIPLVVVLILLRLTTKGFLTGQDRKAMTQNYHKAISKMNLGMFEFVRGMAVIKIFNITADTFQKLKNSIMDYKEIVTLWQKGVAPYRALIASVVLSGGLFILPVSLHFLQNGSIEPIAILFFMLLGTGCFAGLLKVLMVWTRMEFIKVGIKRINTILTIEQLSEPDVPLVPENYDIKLKDVVFQYEKHGPTVLSDINMTMPHGSFTAFVGPSGAGKTTLVNLIARMWDVKQGSIAIGGKTLQEIGTKGVSKIVGTVFQDVYILTDTVANNISMGKKVSRTEIEQAAKAAACHNFIMKLPKGYDTVIGDGGETHLSGGEKQRISLARVLLKNPPVILLDEATSYADAENERQMQEAFSRLMKNKTVIVIAHRLATIVNADQIYVIDKGRVVENGVHHELLQKRGLYSRMWAARVEAESWGLKEACRND
ncbi:MAG: ABC transporter ATP-binding protein [archaeon]|nr:ABC transporter ATP-binding protein/permease [Candidatus Bathyarchaeum sp.]